MLKVQSQPGCWMYYMLLCVFGYIRSVCALDVSGAEAATVQICNDTTLYQHQTLHKSALKDAAATAQPEHHSPNKTSNTMMDVQPSFNTTAFHTIMPSEDTTLHAQADESKMAAHSESSAPSPTSTSCISKLSP